MENLCATKKRCSIHLTFLIQLAGKSLIYLLPFLQRLNFVPRSNFVPCQEFVNNGSLISITRCLLWYKPTHQTIKFYTWFNVQVLVIYFFLVYRINGVLDCQVGQLPVPLTQSQYWSSVSRLCYLLSDALLQTMKHCGIENGKIKI